MNRVIALLAVASLAACNGTQKADYTQTQTPVTPKGTIVGRIIDGTTYQGLDGATVTVVGTGTTLTTDADGVFTFKDAVVLSTYFFVIEKAGYLRQTAQTSISGTTGNSPLAGSTTIISATLYKADGQVKGNVFLPDGKPAANATVYVDQRNSGYGDSVVTTTTDTAGAFSLTGLASRPIGLNQTVYALWYDENGDGNADYPTTSVNVSVSTGQVSRTFLTYSSNVGQRVISTNIIDAQLAPATDISMTFALPLLPSNLNGAAGQAFTLTDNTRNTNVNVVPTWEADGVSVTLKPASPLATGERYTLSVNLTYASAGPNNANANYGNSWTFQVRPDGTVPTYTTQVTNLTLTNGSPIDGSIAALSKYNWNSNYFRLQWDAPTDAASFNVYAKDTKLNPDWVLVQVGITPVPGRNGTYVSLPAAFDVYPTTGNVEPLGLGNSVTFAVVGVDVYGNIAPLASAPTGQASDNIPPTIISGLQALNYDSVFGIVDAINDTAASVTWPLQIRYSEPMDPASAPTFTASGAPATSWIVNNQGGVYYYQLNLTIAAGADNTGPFLIRGGKDFAGNVVLDGDLQGTLGGVKNFLTLGGFEDNSGCTLGTGSAGWTTSGSLAPTATLATGTNGRCGAVLGAYATGATLSGGSTSRMYQDFTVQTIPTGSGWSYYAQVHYRAQVTTGAAVAAQCRITDTNDVLQQTLFSISGTTNEAYTTPYLNLGTLSTARFVCEVNNTGTTASSQTLYVDDVQVYLYKPGTI
jgi:hypothetical protein